MNIEKLQLQFFSIENLFFKISFQQSNLLWTWLYFIHRWLSPTMATHVRALSDSHCCRLYREIPTTVLAYSSIILLLRLLWLYIYGINLSELTIARVTLVLIPCPISTPPWEMATVPSFLNTETEAWKLPYVSRGNFIGTKLIPLFFQTFALKNNVFHSL